MFTVSYNNCNQVLCNNHDRPTIQCGASIIMLPYNHVSKSKLPPHLVPKKCIFYRFEPHLIKVKILLPSSLQIKNTMINHVVQSSFDSLQAGFHNLLKFRINLLPQRQGNVSDLQLIGNGMQKHFLHSYHPSSHLTFPTDHMRVYKPFRLASTHLFSRKRNYCNTNNCQNTERNQYTAINLSRRYAKDQTWQTPGMSNHSYSL